MVRVLIAKEPEDMRKSLAGKSRGITVEVKARDMTF